MTHAKHYARTPRKAHLKYLIPVGAVLVLACLFAASTMALISSTSQTIYNQFVAGVMSVETHETFENNTKSDVYVENTGNATVYVRIKLVVQAQDASGNVVANVTDTNGDAVTLDLDCFTFEGLTGENWQLIDDCYYYTLPLTGADETSNDDITTMLFTKATQSVICANGESLVLIVLSEAIQVNGVEDAWDSIDLDSNGNIIEATEVSA